ncbi:hypothetical protein RCL_jg2555.t1 [Rhizophagus clarus]|uniref:Uncharacterized protein n=1 Tax=Rhizophagus clarus TaxID=94130 RepID=A0A8H3QQ30_9GLOM|nr:hypothetical protein RCL_jg2555.t1 [Rhizophagus clarus]
MSRDFCSSTTNHERSRSSCRPNFLSTKSKNLHRGKEPIFQNFLHKILKKRLLIICWSSILKMKDSR